MNGVTDRTILDDHDNPENVWGVVGITNPAQSAFVGLCRQNELVLKLVQVCAHRFGNPEVTERDVALQTLEEEVSKTGAAIDLGALIADSATPEEFATNLSAVVLESRGLG